MFGRLVALLVALISILVVIMQGEPTDKVGGASVDEKTKTIQKKIVTRYKRYKSPRKQPSFDEFCYPKKYTVQNQQAFVGEFMRPGSNNHSLLVFHKIGAGKTCLAIQVCEKWKSRGKPCVVMPASLIPGFRNELRSQCANNNYLSAADRHELAETDADSEEYREIIDDSNDIIDKNYDILSYNKFLTDPPRGTSILIIDEVQNVNSRTGSFYNSLLRWIEKHPDVPVVLMSGTPIFDSSTELYGLARLLRIPIDDYLDKRENNQLQPDDIPVLFKNKISYFPGAPEYTYPKTNIIITRCQMSKHQSRWYLSEVEAEKSKMGNIKLRQVTNDFYVKSRQRSNIVYPNGLKGKSGLDALTPYTIKSQLETYSCKFAKLIPRLARHELSFVYSQFTGEGGLAALIKVLHAYGWRNFADDGPGRKRFVLWTGEESQDQKDLIRATFNSRANDDCSLIQCVIGSPSIKEGASLFRVRSVHILESYWNHSRLEQIYGRAVRYCSHKTLPARQRTVDIYIYAAIRGNDPTPENSIDLYMLAMADEKRAANQPYIDKMIECAVDRLLWR